MPRANPPPTPGSSSDIRGKETDVLAPAFDLPPTAYYPEQDRASSNSSVVSSANGSDSSYRPASSGVAGEFRKRSAPHSGPVITTDDFSLPPPPTRSRKIIQMKPRGPAQHDSSAAQPSQGAARTQTAGAQSGKRKQNAAGQTAAGRKIARKTAHSLIERRRRSKMNEEFGVLKDMIPACQGQEMHKLAILQASIEYLRYLEQCISDLQAQTHSSPSLPPPSARSTRDMHNDDEMNDDDDGEDEEMLDEKSEGEEEVSQPTATAAPTRTNSLISLPSLSQLYPANPTSPPICSSNGTTSSARHFSISSASQPSHSPYIHSNHASPAFGPQLPLYHPPPPQATANHRNSHFGLGSPALKPSDSPPSMESMNKNNSVSTTSNTSNRNLDILRHLAERATAESEHPRHPQQQTEQYESLPPASLSRPHPANPPSHHPADDASSTLFNQDRPIPNNQAKPTQPASSSFNSPSSCSSNPPSNNTPTHSSTADQDATSAAAVALSMLNASTRTSSTSTSSSAPFLSSSLSQQRRRGRTSDPPEEGETQDRDPRAGMPGNWRPLPGSFPTSGQVERDGGAWAQRTLCSSSSSSSSPDFPVGPKKSESLAAVESDGGLDGDAQGGGGGGSWNGSGGGVGGGGISVRDLLSS
ncbi:hypothetical protein D0860_08663 [Hortaea werneckii]|uniref:BHLH domain-containing protein n=1 Tax=Hortaea werneckii TaxID=91943 RepID=A0A3M7G851_HORWE|nr:hypothetical protein D0860_08663 [Hortaea werneckii]